MHAGTHSRQQADAAAGLHCGDSNALLHTCLTGQPLVLCSDDSVASMTELNQPGGPHQLLDVGDAAQTDADTTISGDHCVALLAVRRQKADGAGIKRGIFQSSHKVLLLQAVTLGTETAAGKDLRQVTELEALQRNLSTRIHAYGSILLLLSAAQAVPVQVVAASTHPSKAPHIQAVHEAWLSVSTHALRDEGQPQKMLALRQSNAVIAHPTNAGPLRVQPVVLQVQEGGILRAAQQDLTAASHVTRHHTGPNRVHHVCNQAGGVIGLFPPLGGSSPGAGAVNICQLLEQRGPYCHPADQRGIDHLLQSWRCLLW